MRTVDSMFHQRYSAIRKRDGTFTFRTYNTNRNPMGHSETIYEYGDSHAL